MVWYAFRQTDCLRARRRQLIESARAGLANHADAIIRLTVLQEIYRNADSGHRRPIDSNGFDVAHRGFARRALRRRQSHCSQFSGK